MGKYFSFLRNEPDLDNLEVCYSSVGVATLEAIYLRFFFDEAEHLRLRIWGQAFEDFLGRYI